MQMRFIIASNVPRVIYVSCNPEALAHDATQLRRAGYAVLAATPIDQFPFSENLESVVVFGKGK
jgi:23S rRNA (uracil1939-C5)-methyltransferase